MGSRNIIGQWDGGVVVEKSNGKRVYYIRKRMDGHLFDISTRTSSWKAALAHYARFLDCPAAYTPAGVANPTTKGGVALTEDTIEKHLAASEADGTSAEWRRKKRIYLERWAEQIGKRDLRSLTHKDFSKMLEGAKARHHRVAAIKHLYAWLRDEGVITRGEDPTLDLKGGQQKSAAAQGRMRAISRDEFAKTFAKVDSAVYRDVLTVLSGSGAHVEEVLRLAQGQGEIGANTIAFPHKIGRFHRQRVEPFVAQAAQRVRDAGGFSISRLSKTVRQAAKDAVVRPWAPGSMRHSVATWLFEEGSTLEEISQWLGHLSPATTRKFYAAFAAAPIPKGASFSAPRYLVPVK
jgi:integrase